MLVAPLCLHYTTHIHTRSTVARSTRSTGFQCRRIDRSWYVFGILVDASWNDRFRYTKRFFITTLCVSWFSNHSFTNNYHTTLLNEQSNTQSPRGQLFYLYIYTYMYIYICISMTVSRCRFTAAGLFTILTRNSVVRSSCKREQRFRWEQKLRANQTSSCCKDLCIVPSRCCRYVRDVS